MKQPKVMISEKGSGRFDTYPVTSMHWNHLGEITHLKVEFTGELVMLKQYNDDGDEIFVNSFGSLIGELID